MIVKSDAKLIAAMAGILFSLALIAVPAVAAEFVVKTTLDAPDTAAGDGNCVSTLASGLCTLRAAIEEANVLAGADIIKFDIPPTDPGCASIVGQPGNIVCTITLTVDTALPAGADPLPPITQPLNLLGNTQEQFEPGNCQLVPTGRPCIVIDGKNVPAAAVNSNGLTIFAPNVDVKGLVIINFPTDGIKIGPTCKNVIDVAEVMKVIPANGLLTCNVVIDGNFIGVAADGVTAAGNGDDGVDIDPLDGNIIEDNVISANAGNGVVIDGDSNLVRGNKIGTDFSGTLDLGNGLNGVLITVSAGADNTVGFLGFIDSAFNVIGGTTAAARNIISGNGRNGVLLDGSLFLAAVEANSVLGNYIGTDASGTVALPNDEDGVNLVGAILENCIGGLFTPGPGPGSCKPQLGTLPTGLAGNVISGNGTPGGPNTNGDNGIEFNNTFLTVLNSVISNFIGLDATGLKALGNRDNGIFDNSDLGINCIGSSFILNGCAAISGVINGRNVISGNGRDGIKLKGSPSFLSTLVPIPPFPTPILDVIIANYIGTNKDGVACSPTPCGNGDDGIDLDPIILAIIGGNAARNPLVRNVISGNGFPACVDTTNGCNGVEISGAVVPPPGCSGFFIGGGSASLVTVPASTTPEQLAPSLNATSCFNFVQGNFIGTDKTGLNPLSNKNDGVLIRNGAQFNVVGDGSFAPGNIPCTQGLGNVIAFNGGAGVHVDGGQTFSNTIRCNSIHDNVGKGIALTNGANNGILAPTVTATGTIDGKANVGSTVDGYNDNNGQGRTYISSTDTLFNCNGAGICQFHINVNPNVNPNATATQTDQLGDTSEFSNSVLTNHAPVANAGPNQVVAAGTPVTQTGSCTDPDDLVCDTTNHTFLWSVDSAGNTAGCSISGPTNQANVTVNTTTPGVCTVRLRVTDSGGLFGESTFQINATGVVCNVSAVTVPVTDPLHFRRNQTRTIDLTVTNAASSTGAATITGITAVAGKNLSVSAVYFGKKKLLPLFSIQVPAGGAQTLRLKLKSSVKQEVNPAFVQVAGVCGAVAFNVPANDRMLQFIPALTLFSLEQLTVRTQAGQILAEAQGMGIRSLQLQVFDVNGHLVIEQTATSVSMKLAAIDRSGLPLANGVYLALVTVRGVDGKSVRSELKKVLIVR